MCSQRDRICLVDTRMVGLRQWNWPCRWSNEGWTSNWSLYACLGGGGMLCAVSPRLRALLLVYISTTFTHIFSPPPHHAQLWDSPRTEQVRPANTSSITAADLVDTMEMVLGALGREAVGMGAESDNPADDPAWVGMDFQGKLESFAPVWRVMRGEALPLEEVEQQLRALTGVMKAASAESDIRNHTFTGTVQVGRGGG